MQRLTQYFNGYAHGAAGRSPDHLIGSYCRGEFEATACVERLAAYEDTGLTSEQIHNQKHNIDIAHNIISGYEQCIREIFKRQQEHNGRQYIDAEEAAGIIDKIMSGRLKEVKR